MSDYARKIAEKDANSGSGPRDVSKEPSQTQEKYNAAFDRAKKN